MKHLFYSLLLVSTVATAQTNLSVTSAEYQNLKSSGQLDPQVHYQITDFAAANGIQYTGAPQKSGVCDCMVPLDASFSLAMLPNDDEFSNVIHLPFSFNFYGTTYDSLYINNNGNISFVAPYFTFTANPFPDATYNMIAPFWGDVDTRETVDTLGNTTTAGAVWYKITPTSMIVKWEQVGYFNVHSDKTNTFQLIITDGTDPLIPFGNNVAFCYGDMQWTTGDASSGMNGFGGAPATVGVNLGNGIDFFQVGQFDAPGAAFDGPYGSSDQISFLDNMEVYFNVDVTSGSTNVPPMVVASGICDTIDVYTGDTLVKSINSVDFSVLVATPEAGQTVNAVVYCTQNPGMVTYTETVISGEATRLDITVDGTGVAPGDDFVVTIQATDNGTPSAVTVVNIPVRVIYDGSLSLGDESMSTLTLSPNPATTTLSVSGLEANADFRILTLTGESMPKGSVAGNKMDVSHLANGIYLLQITDEKGASTTRRFVKE